MAMLTAAASGDERAWAELAHEARANGDDVMAWWTITNVAVALAARLGQEVGATALEVLQQLGLRVGELDDDA